MVRGRDEEDAGLVSEGDGGVMLWACLELGLGTGGSFMGFFDGWWSAGDDMLRSCVKGTLRVSELGLITALAGEWRLACGKGMNAVRGACAARYAHVAGNRVSDAVSREGMLCLSMVSHAVGSMCACHCRWLSEDETRGRAEVHVRRGVTSRARVNVRCTWTAPSAIQEKVLEDTTYTIQTRSNG